MLKSTPIASGAKPGYNSSFRSVGWDKTRKLRADCHRQKINSEALNALTFLPELQPTRRM